MQLKFRFSKKATKFWQSSTEYSEIIFNSYAKQIIVFCEQKLGIILENKVFQKLKFPKISKRKKKEIGMPINFT